VLYSTKLQDWGRDEALFFVFVDFHSSAVEVFFWWEVALLCWVFGFRRFEAV